MNFNLPNIVKSLAKQRINTIWFFLEQPSSFCILSVYSEVIVKTRNNYLLVTEEAAGVAYLQLPTHASRISSLGSKFSWLCSKLS